MRVTPRHNLAAGRRFHRGWALIRRHIPARYGTPYRELQSGLLYGVLAHSHAWKRTPYESITSQLRRADQEHATHPREMIDLLCVADQGVWLVYKNPWYGPRSRPHWTKGFIEHYGQEGSPSSGYFSRSVVDDPKIVSTPIGGLLTFLWRKLAWENPTLRSIAEYFSSVPLIDELTAAQMARPWRAVEEVYSPEVLKVMREQGPQVGIPWNEWAAIIA